MLLGSLHVTDIPTHPLLGSQLVRVSLHAPPEFAPLATRMRILVPNRPEHTHLNACSVAFILVHSGRILVVSDQNARSGGAFWSHSGLHIRHQRPTKVGILRLPGLFLGCNSVAPTMNNTLLPGRDCTCHSSCFGMPKILPSPACNGAHCILPSASSDHHGLFS